MKLKNLLVLFLFCVTSVMAWATHNRAGEITYRHISGYTYEIKIVTCTKTSVIADREYLKINWGDIPTGAQLDSLKRDSTIFLTNIDAQRNVYIGTHTYSGPGVYEISMLDPNRNEGVINFNYIPPPPNDNPPPGSVNIPFCIVSTLIISPETGHNNSVLLLNPPKERACLNKRWIHNPGAYDPDGDVLQFSLVGCRGDSCQFESSWQLPDDATEADDTFSINPVTGDIVWEFPPLAGEYNIAILIEEFRPNPITGELKLVGSVVRDMQIEVLICDNNPPVITPINDTCIVAGNSLQLNVEAFDPDGDNIILSALGSPFETENEAGFNAATGQFFWNPECEEVQLAPHLVYFKATDTNWQVPLSDMITVGIRVISPPVENPIAEPLGNSMTLTWDVSPCEEIFNDFEASKVNYKIYRRQGLFGYEPDYCETGVPEYTGYALHATVNGLNNTSYVDTDVFFGGEFCYMVVTCFPDGSESIASEEFCGQIQKDVPVITNVSVNITDQSEGEIYVAWSPPSELDTTTFPAPYQYKVYHGEGYSGANDLIYESDLGSILYFGDTTYTHSGGLNTLDVPNNYRVDFYSGDDLILVTQSSSASSVFIELVPNDNQLEIQINHQVPWPNSKYDIYKFNGVDYDLIAVTNEQSYIDSGLVNNQEYCYKVMSTGSYESATIIDPLLNWSQETCGKPFDLTPPCPPVLTLNPDCPEEELLVTWTNPNETCADDVTGYNLYYSPIEGGELIYLDSFAPDTDTLLVFDEFEGINTIAGCFAVTALDSLLPGPGGAPNQNESEFSNIVCSDNCPLYFLPNVFSPNGDNLNDLFGPISLKFIATVDCRIFNRWGGLVYETNDPLILWDGTNMESGELSADGTYYYTITVSTIRLSGIVPENLSGTVTLVGGKNKSND